MWLRKHCGGGPGDLRARLHERFVGQGAAAAAALLRHCIKAIVAFSEFSLEAGKRTAHRANGIAKGGGRRRRVAKE